jgi:hypothetical protein
MIKVDLTNTSADHLFFENVYISLLELTSFKQFSFKEIRIGMLFHRKRFQSCSQNCYFVQGSRIRIQIFITFFKSHLKSESL